MDLSADSRLTNPISGGSFDTPHAAAILVAGALILLIGIRRGFRGVNLAGVHVGIS